MVKPNYRSEKRQRELKKSLKQEEKRRKKQARHETPEIPESEIPDTEKKPTA